MIRRIPVLLLFPYCDWQPSLNLIFGLLPSSWISLFSVHTAGLLSISFELIPLSQRAFSHQLKRALFPILSHLYFNSFIYLLIVIQSVLPEWKPLKTRGFSHLICHCLPRYTIWKDICLYFTLNVIYFDGFSVDAGLFIWISWFSWGEFWLVH